MTLTPKGMRAPPVKNQCTEEYCEYNVEALSSGVHSWLKRRSFKIFCDKIIIIIIIIIIIT
jgi:t-SNARE complex subunit (syntaxin)